MKTLKSEILDDEAPDPKARDVTPGWIGRNRAALAELRRLAASAAIVAPPPARIPLAAGCLAIDGAFLAEEARTGRLPVKTVAWRAVGIALESGTLLASTRLAPQVIARNAARIVAARRLFERLDRAEA